MTVVDSAAAGIDAIPTPPATDLALEGMVAEVRIEGFPVGPEPPTPRAEDCEHSEEIIASTYVGFIPDESGAIVGWELRVRAQCGVCTTVFDFDPEASRPPADEEPGIVVVMRPASTIGATPGRPLEEDRCS